MNSSTICLNTSLLDMGLGLRVERTSEVGLVSLDESWAANWVLIVVGINAAGSEDCDVDAFLEAAVGQVQGTNDIVSDGLLLVVLTPVDVWPASRSSSVQDVGWLDSLELGDDGLSVLHANSRGVNLLSCTIVSFEIVSWRENDLP